MAMRRYIRCPDGTILVWTEAQANIQGNQVVLLPEGVYGTLTPDQVEEVQASGRRVKAVDAEPKPVPKAEAAIPIASEPETPGPATEEPKPELDEQPTAGQPADEEEPAPAPVAFEVHPEAAPEPPPATPPEVQEAPINEPSPLTLTYRQVMKLKEEEIFELANRLGVEVNRKAKHGRTTMAAALWHHICRMKGA